MEIIGSIACETSINRIVNRIINKETFFDYVTRNVCVVDSPIIKNHYSCEDFEDSTFMFYFSNDLLLPSGFALVRIGGTIDYNGNQEALLEKLRRNEYFIKFIDENISRFKDEVNNKSKVFFPTTIDFVTYDNRIFVDSSKYESKEDLKPFKLFDNITEVKDIEYTLIH